MFTLKKYTAWLTKYSKPANSSTIEALSASEAAEAFVECREAGDYEDGDEVFVTVLSDDGVISRFVVEVCFSIDYTAYEDEEWDDDGMGDCLVED